MITSELNKKAWQIRKAAAANFDCQVMEVVWGLCLEMAKAGKETEMKGSEKQIKWAENLKAAWNDAAETFKGKTPIIDQAIETILEIEYADFWIDSFGHDNPVAKDSVMVALKKLEKGTLRYKGLGYKATMQIALDGTVTKK